MAMTQNRDNTRFLKRLQVKYGEESPTRTGFTEDISEEGFFIKTALVRPPRTILNIELTTPARDVISLEGEVRWAKKVPPNLLRLVKKAGMGIKIYRFLAGEEHYRELCQVMRARMA